MKLDHVKIGDRLVVRNGARGEQVAVVASRTREGAVRAHKWLMRGARWTKPVTLYEADTLRYATPEDFRKRRVKAGASVGR